ncbi:MAG: cyclic nucleotide-binding domain-containing protein [Planctomycetota bacterium]
MPKKILAVAEKVHDCPIFKTGDRMVLSLPELITAECDAVCAIALSDLLPWTIKLTAGGEADDRVLLCRGCRGGRAQAGFRLESQGELKRDPQQTRKLISLRVIPMFAALPDRELEKIGPMIQEVDFPSGEEIITYGQPGKALMIITRGQVEVLKPNDDGSEKLLGILSHGECFGEMSLLTGDPCSATIRAREGVRALQITKRDFDSLLGRNPVLNKYFSKLLALRLNNMSKQFSDEKTQGVSGNLTMIGPAELVQAITVTDRTGTLEILSAEKQIRLFFHDGQIWSIHANFADGAEESFYEFLTWNTGKFSFENAEVPPDADRDAARDTTSLLLEGMRRLDEVQA